MISLSEKTNIEKVLGDKDVLISRTDVKGKITYVSEDFIRISGYSETELKGQPHNIVRHPDMPRSIFRTLWQTIQNNKPWTGLVKNKCKNGDFYWVDATITPIIKDNIIVGFMSVRKKPIKEHVLLAEKNYSKLRDLEKRKHKNFISFVPSLELFLLNTSFKNIFFLLLNGLLVSFVLLIFIYFFYTYQLQQNRSFQIKNLRQAKNILFLVDDILSLKEESSANKISDSFISKVQLLENEILDDGIKQEYQFTFQKLISDSNSLDARFHFTLTLCQLYKKSIAEALRSGAFFHYNDLFEVITANNEIFTAIYTELNREQAKKDPHLNYRENDFSFIVNKNIYLLEKNKNLIYLKYPEIKNELTSLLATAQKKDLYNTASMKSFLLSSSNLLKKTNQRFLHIAEEDSFETDRLNFSIGTIFLVILSVLWFFSYKIYHINISKINKNVTMGNRLAGGDLKLDIDDIVATGEFSQILLALKSLSISLWGIIYQIRKSNEDADLLSSQLLVSANELSDFTKLQARTSEEITTAIEEMVSTIDSIKENIHLQNQGFHYIHDDIHKINHGILDSSNELKQLNTVAKKTADKAMFGEDAIQKLLTTMEDIKNNSYQIKEIISLITDIADRTNLLSLNASIESARAGNSGRGFTVVANEISKLADQTTLRVKDITSLVSITNKSVEKAVVDVKAAVGFLNDIIYSVKDISQASGKVFDTIQNEMEQINSVENSINKVQNLATEIENSIITQKNTTDEIAVTVQKTTQSISEIVNKFELLTVISDEMKQQPKVMSDLVEHYNL